MIRLTYQPSHNEIEQAVCTWFDLLSEEKYSEAYAFTLHDPYYKWTPILLEQIINGYGLPYDNNGTKKHKVTKRSIAKDDGSLHNRSINLFEKNQIVKNQDFSLIGEVYYDLPIDNEWSDLTATFRILQFTNYSTLELNEIHVM